jgi:hypothetical protein
MSSGTVSLGIVKLGLVADVSPLPSFASCSAIQRATICRMMCIGLLIKARLKSLKSLVMIAFHWAAEPPI